MLLQTRFAILFSYVHTVFWNCFVLYGEEFLGCQLTSSQPEVKCLWCGTCHLLPDSLPDQVVITAIELFL